MPATRYGARPSISERASSAERRRGYKPGSWIGSGTTASMRAQRDATSVVYEARHLVLPRRAILKVMQRGARIAAVQLLREACILEALEHPGIVRVYESGLLAGSPAVVRARARRRRDRRRSAVATARLDPPHAAVAAPRHRRGARARASPRRHPLRRCAPIASSSPGRTRGFPLCIVDWSDARMHDTIRAAARARSRRLRRARARQRRGDRRSRRRVRARRDRVSSAHRRAAVRRRVARDRRRRRDAARADRSRAAPRRRRS